MAEKVYPKSVATSGRKGMVFATEFNMRSNTNKSKPLSGVESWSGIQLNFSNSENKTGGDGNIEENHLYDAVERTRFALGKIMEAEARQTNKDSNDPVTKAMEALQVRISYLPMNMKASKGQPAWDIASQYDWQTVMIAVTNLRNTTGAYASKNAAQAEALSTAKIIQTVREYEGNGQAAAVAQIKATVASEYACLLTATDLRASSTEVYKIYEADLKTPHNSKVDAAGYTEAYSMKVLCYPENEYPFHCELTTMKGIPTPNQKVGIQGTTIKDRKTFSVDLMSWEWLDAIEKANLNREELYMLTANTRFSNCWTIVEQERAKGRQQMQTTPQQYPQYQQQIPQQ